MAVSHYIFMMNVTVQYFVSDCLLTLFWSAVSWVVANILTDSFCCFWKCDRNSGCRICIMVCPNFGTYLSAPTVGNWSHWVMVWHFVKELSWGHDSTHCHVTFKLLLWRFLCNFIYMRCLMQRLTWCLPDNLCPRGE